MTNPNQQLLDYAVENIKEWHPHHTCLRSDRSAYPLFYTGQYDGWDLHDNQWYDGGNFAKLEGTLGKTTPQVITKDEWLAEIKRREEDKPVVLERDKEYDVKLTGEELVWLQFVTDRSCSMLAYELGNKVRKALNSFQNQVGDSPASSTNGTGWAAGYQAEVVKWLDKVFTPPETEEERKLRELKEKYAELGETIKAMERK